MMIKQDLEQNFHIHERKDYLTGQIMRTWHHSSGMRVKFLPKPGFSRRFAAITVPYGSIHQVFNSQAQTVNVPAGSAHFLEHCIFSRDQAGGLLNTLSALGASANAYTSHTHTMYYFTAVNNFEEALELYLKALFNPYLEADRIEAERPIIIEELNQYLDDPDNRNYMQLLENLFQEHTVRDDIGGTPASVNRITGEHLQIIHQTYYSPANLSLTVSGDFDEAKIIDSLLGLVAESSQIKTENSFLPEPEEILKDMAVLQMDVVAPSFLIGVKDSSILPQRPLMGLGLIKRQRAARLVLATLLSTVSSIYERMYKEGLLNDSFSYHYACEQNFAFLAMGGESPEPEKSCQTLMALLEEELDKGIDQSLFAIQKKAAAGDFVKSLDVVEYTGMVQARCNLHEVDLFDYPMLYDSIDAKFAENITDFMRNKDNFSCSIVRD